MEVVNDFLSKVAAISISDQGANGRNFLVHSYNEYKKFTLWFYFDESLIKESYLLKSTFFLEGYSARDFILSVLAKEGIVGTKGETA